MQTVIGLTVQEWTLVAWVIGALWSILLPYFRKWKESDYTLQFNPGYIVNFLMSIGVGITFNLSLYAVWIPPNAVAPFIILAALLAGAGIDSKVIQDILKLANFYQKIWDKTRGKPVEITLEDLPFVEDFVEEPEPEPVSEPEPPADETPSLEDLTPPVSEPSGEE